MGQSVRLQGDRPKCGKKWHILIKTWCYFNLPHCSSHNTSFFFYTNESQSFANALSFKSALKIPPKIKSINAALSEVFFFYTLPCSRPPISLPLHANADISSKPLIRSNKGLALETSAFQYFYGSKFDLRPWGHLSINKFMRQSFACVTSFKTLISRLC